MGVCLLISSGVAGCQIGTILEATTAIVPSGGLATITVVVGRSPGQRGVVVAFVTLPTNAAPLASFTTCRIGHVCVCEERLMHSSGAP